jgi:hypothetical protein
MSDLKTRSRVMSDLKTLKMVFSEGDVDTDWWKVAKGLMECIEELEAIDKLFFTRIRLIASDCYSQLLIARGMADDMLAEREKAAKKGIYIQDPQEGYE